MTMFAMVLLSLFAHQNPAQKLEADLSGWMSQAPVPGMCMAYIEDGKPVWQKPFGVSNAETGDTLNLDAVFEAASLSKPVFAYLCMRLVDQGVLDLDQSLAEILPNPRMSHDDRYKLFTARMILSHRSGLPNWGGSKLDLQFDPGSAFQYSGEGYVYLSQVVEKLTGEDLRILFKREVFDPLGMTMSAFTWQPVYEKKLVTSHDRFGRPLARHEPKHTVNTAASLYTTVGDYTRFVQAIMAGEGLEKTTFRQMLQSQGQAKLFPPKGSPVDPNIHWALGWGIVKINGSTYYWHWGDNGSYKSWVIWDGEKKRSLMYFANGQEAHSLLAKISNTFDKGLSQTMDQLGYESFTRPGRKERFAGERLIQSGNYQGASSKFRAAVMKNPENEVLVTYLSWSLDLHRAMESPTILDKQTMSRLAGKYGPRRLFIEHDALHYQREGRSKYRLIPLRGNVFALEGEFDFRIQVVEEGGVPKKIVGHYVNGDQDETPRDPEEHQP